MSHWIDGTDTVRDLRDLTDSLDMVRSKRGFSEQENEFAAACANGVASKLHVEYVASHIASVSSYDDRPKGEKNDNKGIKSTEVNLVWLVQRHRLISTLPPWASKLLGEDF
ncbi:hypothetical protein TrVFT333_004558 [Trichoderma virens FT-333]|nr:hypothetical protein TrVFT333_004558 [Trichoderma virens FT-333]